MVAIPTRAQVVKQRAPGGWWELAVRAPVASIRPCVRGYMGYIESAPGLQRRREFPAPLVVLIFDLGPPLRLLDPADESRSASYGAGFVAGLGDTYAVTEHDGFSFGMQVNLTPIGARQILNRPMSELTNQVVAMDDLFTGVDRDMPHRLRDARSWDARFDLLDGFFARRWASAPAPLGPTAWALAQIEASGGQIDIGSLAREIGWSPKHLIARFRDQVGLPPKLVARLVRFDRVIRHLRAGSADGWAEIALAHGYYDQAHLIRDIRHFTGTTPTEARAMIATGPALPATGDR